MPLAQGTSNSTRQANIAEMVRSGHKPSQAVAAAYNQQRQSRARLRRRKGQKHRGSQYSLQMARRSISPHLHSTKAYVASKATGKNVDQAADAREFSRKGDHKRASWAHQKLAINHYELGHKDAGDAHVKAMVAHTQAGGGRFESNQMSLKGATRLYKIAKETKVDPFELSRRAHNQSRESGYPHPDTHSALEAASEGRHKGAAELHHKLAQHHLTQHQLFTAGSDAPEDVKLAGEQNFGEHYGKLHKRAHLSHKIAAQAHDWAAHTQKKKQVGRFSPAQMSITPKVQDNSLINEVYDFDDTQEPGVKLDWEHPTKE